MLEKQNLSQVK